MWYSHAMHVNSQTQNDCLRKVVASGWQCWGKMESWLLMGTGFLLGDENVLKNFVVMAAQSCDYTKKQWAIHTLKG